MDRLTDVVGLRRDGTHVAGVRLKDGSTLGCETLIVAMGAWTGPAMAQWLGISLPIEPHSLQKLRVRPAGPLPACAIRKQHPFLPMILPGRVLQSAVAT